MRLIVLVTALAAIACTSATKTSAADPCVSEPGDTIYTALRPAYRECNVSSRAVPITPMAHPQFTTSTSTRERGSSCSSVELEFVINELGLVETQSAHVLRTTDPQFADAVVSVLPAWHFQPAIKDGQSVRQITRLKTSVQSVSVAVPAGSGPPRQPPPGTRAPSC